MRALRLLEIARCREQLAISYAVGDLRFRTSIWYEDVDLDALAARHGESFERIAFHIALFQMNTALSLRPEAIELGAWARFATPRFRKLYATVFHRVWAQWRWEHGLPDERLPPFAEAPGPDGPPAVTPDGPTELLAFCGGGKDSLVALRLLERSGQGFATLGYSSSIYGPPEPQHALLERIAGASGRQRAERVWIYDDLLDSPVVRLRPSLGVRSLTAAETPASLFLALPLVLARGYHGLVVAHERGASSANLSWAATGEEVNHQWGKSWEAERLLDDYLGTLVADLRYFSVLAPIHDELVFELLSGDPLAGQTHSCNIRKPWCGRCAKCVYVWLQMMAHLPQDEVRRWFAEAGCPGDLTERPENQRWLRELFGLAEHTPFECVGSVSEARLALALARGAGLAGPRLDALAAEIGPIDVAALAGPLVEVGEIHGMPEVVASRVMPQLTAAAAAARRRLGR